MTELDWGILSVTVLIALSGFRRGLIVSALSLIGFGAGALIGTRVAESLLSGGATSPYAPLFGLLGALLAGGILAGGLEGVALRLRSALRLPGLRLIDGLGGALFSAAVALAVAWVLGTVILTLPGANGLSATIERSTILRRLDELLPSDKLLNFIARIDPLPTVAGSTLSLAPARAAILRAPRVRAAQRSVVRVLGIACGIGIEGSGWVVGAGEVLTNAHVVAGESDTSVEVGGVPPELPATVVLFDPRNDLAVLRVRGLRLPVLRLASAPASGTAGAILGYPENGPFVAQPGRAGATQPVQTQDAYGRGPVLRVLTAVRGLVRPGNSGGPLVDRDGQVVTTIFAASTTPGPHGGFGVANVTVRSDLRRVGSPVSTEGCAA